MREQNPRLWLIFEPLSSGHIQPAGATSFKTRHGDLLLVQLPYLEGSCGVLGCDAQACVWRRRDCPESASETGEGTRYFPTHTLFQVPWPIKNRLSRPLRSPILRLLPKRPPINSSSPRQRPSLGPNWHLSIWLTPQRCPRMRTGAPRSSVSAGPW
jgi:hypothetical protein